LGVLGKIADVTVLEPTVPTEAHTEETGRLPRVPDRERRRATATVKQLAPGRYVAIEDAGEVVLLPLTAEVTHLGRSQSADIVLDDASVSRRHAIITVRAGRTVVLDDRSLNGIVVNGARVREATLDDGDTIVIGRVVLRYHEVNAR
jgi:pSer/pThr/pTyr-binding forkhead associated (FHA) protein